MVSVPLNHYPNLFPTHCVSCHRKLCVTVLALDSQGHLYPTFCAPESQIYFSSQDCQSRLPCPGYLHMNVSCHNFSAQTYSYICVYDFTQQDQCINWHLSWGKSQRGSLFPSQSIAVSCQYYFCLNNLVSSPPAPPPRCRGSWSSHTWPTAITFLTTVLVSALIPHLCSLHNRKKDLRGGQILPCLAPSWSPCLVCWVKVIHDFPLPQLLLSSLETFTPASLIACSFVHLHNFFLLVLATLSPLLVLPHSHLLFFWFNQNYSFNSQLGVSYAHESSLCPSPSFPPTAAAVWSGHPRRPLSWSLYISCSSSACFTYALLTWLAFPPPCPHPS